MAVQGTLLGALRGYFGSLSFVENVRGYYSVAGESMPSAIAGGVNDVLAGCVLDRVAIQAEIAAARALNTGDDLKILEVASTLVDGCLVEAQSWAMGGTVGGKALGVGAPPVGFMIRVAEAGTGKWIKGALAWIAAIFAAGAGSIVLYRWWQKTDPMHGVEAGFALWDKIAERTASDLAACGEDQACRKGVLERAAAMNNLVGFGIMKDLGRDGSGCGLLDTASGTMIGALVGAGFGWSGMRRLMRS